MLATIIYLIIKLKNKESTAAAAGFGGFNFDSYHYWFRLGVVKDLTVHGFVKDSPTPFIFFELVNSWRKTQYWFITGAKYVGCCHCGRPKPRQLIRFKRTIQPIQPFPAVVAAALAEHRHVSSRGSAAYRGGQPRRLNHSFELNLSFELNQILYTIQDFSMLNIII